jgi:hypothetical protein
MEQSEPERSSSFQDVLSEKLRVKNQRIALQEKKRLLKEQQMRLRRLLARELQRIHSAKPAAVPIAVSRTVSIDDMLPEQASMSGKRALESTVSSTQHDVAQDVIPRIIRNRENSTMHQKLKELEIEWYRIGDNIRRMKEDEDALERRIKRLRYVVEA